LGGHFAVAAQASGLNVGRSRAPGGSSSRAPAPAKNLAKPRLPAGAAGSAPIDLAFHPRGSLTVFCSGASSRSTPTPISTDRSVGRPSPVSWNRHGPRSPTRRLNPVGATWCGRTSSRCSDSCSRHSRIALRRYASELVQPERLAMTTF